MISPNYVSSHTKTHGAIRTVLGDLTELPEGTFYAHEHLLIHSRFIAAAFPHIHLDDVSAAISEVRACSRGGAGAIVDAMPAASGRDVVGLAEISHRTGVPILAATGLHHDRYYGPGHWSNNVGIDILVDLMVADLTEGIDAFDYTSPIIRRTSHRAGFIKVATRGSEPDERDLRNLSAVGRASVATGCPVLTHCEAGLGGLSQIEGLAAEGVPPAAIILSHVDKVNDLGYLTELVAEGAVLNFDQALRQREQGAQSASVRMLVELVARGYENQMVVGADAARRTLWHSLGGGPGLSWLGTKLPKMLSEAGLNEEQTHKIIRTNACRAYTWRPIG